MKYSLPDLDALSDPELSVCAYALAAQPQNEELICTTINSLAKGAKLQTFCTVLHLAGVGKQLYKDVLPHSLLQYSREEVQYLYDTGLLRDLLARQPDDCAVSLVFALDSKLGSREGRREKQI